MILKRRKKHGQSLLELTAVIILVLAAFIVFQKFIVRGFTGRWKGVGNMFAEGRIYDPKKTTECATNVFFPGMASGIWYNQTCFEEDNCKYHCLEITKTLLGCAGCLAGCQSVYCND